MKTRGMLGTLLAGAALALPAAAQDLQVLYQGPGEPTLAPGIEWGSSVAAVERPIGTLLLIGGPNYGNDDGRAVLVDPVSGNTHWTYASQGAGSRFGEVVVAGGSVNGDLIADFAISAPREDFLSFSPPGLYDEAGAVYVYAFTGTSLPYVELHGHATGDRFGEALVLDGDVDGDGRADILVGAPYATVGGHAEGGYVELYSGATGALIKRLEGGQTGEHFGFAVAFLGDMNGDGKSEYAVGAPGYDLASPVFTDGGRVAVYNAATHGTLFTRFGGNDEELGTALAALGSTDGDALKELAMGAPGYANDAGRVLVVEGTSGADFLTWTGPGATTGERFGIWISTGGDIDKDGHAETVVGGLFGGSPQQHGFVRVFRGSNGTPWKTIYLAPGSKGGYAFDGGKDVNGDGWPDLVVGRPAADIDGTNSGYVEAWGFLHYQDDLGFGGPGNAHLSVYGAELASGQQADLLLEGAPDDFATVHLLVGFGTAFTPFKGGTLVPSLAPSLVVPLVTNSQGAVLVPGIPGGSGTGGIVHAYIQTLMPWSLPPFSGVEISNAVDLEFLP